MNRLIKIVLIALMIPMVFSCKNDDLENLERLPDVPDGYVRAALDLSVANNEDVGTRATDTEEEAYDRNYVWGVMFNAKSADDPTPATIVHAPVKATKVGNDLYVLLRATTQPVTILVVTGLTQAQNDKLANSAAFKESITTYDEVNALIKTADIDGNGVPIGGQGKYFPMTTDHIFKKTGTINMPKITERLKRMVAKIDVDALKIQTKDFLIEEVTLVNGAKRGLVMPTPTLTPYSDAKDVVRYNAVSKDATNNQVTSKIYLYENNAVKGDKTANPTMLIVKGKYNQSTVSTFYRLDLHKDNGDKTVTPYSIERNKRYKLNLTKVKNSGYLSFDEALKNLPSNIQYTVDVTDPSAGDVVSNGQYYLSVSNSELVLYGAVGEVLAATVTTNAPSTVTTKTVTVSSGLTPVTTQLTSPNGGVTKTDIKVKVPAGFADKQTITIQIGNLTKVITVTYKNVLPSGNHIIDDFKGDENIAGNVEKDGSDVGHGSWLQLSSQASGSNPSKDMVSPDGGIYMVISGYVRTADAEFYITRSKNDSRVRVIAAGNSVKIGKLYWARGNLVAKNNRECLIGAQTDGGLYFQYGSLIGWKGGANAKGGTGVGKQEKGSSFWSGGSWTWNGEAMVWPGNLSGQPDGWPPYGSNSDKWYAGKTKLPNIKEDLSAFGVGDPCAYYLGSLWRLPTRDEFTSLSGKGLTNSWDDTDKGRWVTTQDKTSVFFPASGIRRESGGSFDHVNGTGIYRASSAAAPDPTYADVLQFSSGAFTPTHSNFRAFAGNVRCVHGMPKERPVVNRPTKEDWIEINGLKWTKGNLVAKDNHGCKVGAKNDGGLYFQYGSLIGWKGGADANNGTGVGMPTKSNRFWAGDGRLWSWDGEAMVWPEEMSGTPDKWQRDQMENKWYSGASKGIDYNTEMGEKGVGDPCTHYLGNPWRLPTTDEYAALVKAGQSAWNSTEKGYWIGPNPGNPSTSVFFPCSGFRQDVSGQINNSGVSVNYWTSSVADREGSYDFEFNSSSVTPKYRNSRSYGFVVRCVSGHLENAPIWQEGHIMRVKDRWWTTTNLVAKHGSNNHECEISISTGDGGLYFQYGSLIGWKGGRKESNGTGSGLPTDKNGGYWYGGSSWTWSEAMVWPKNLAEKPTSWPQNQTTDQWYSGTVDGFVNQGADLSSKGVGDPCTYYLGHPWRLPTTEEFKALVTNPGTDPSHNKPYYGSWVTSLPGPGRYVGPGAYYSFLEERVFLSGAGFRDATTGKISNVAESVNYWSSSVASDIGGKRVALDLEFNKTSVTPSWPNNRSYAFPVRCISSVRPR